MNLIWLIVMEWKLFISCSMVHNASSASLAEVSYFVVEIGSLEQTELQDAATQLWLSTFGFVIYPTRLERSGLETDQLRLCMLMAWKEGESKLDSIVKYLYQGGGLWRYVELPLASTHFLAKGWNCIQQQQRVLFINDLVVFYLSHM